MYYPPRLLPILGDSDIPLVGGSRLSLLTIILSHLLLTARDEFPVTNPIKHGPGRNHFVRRLHYATGEIRSYTLYFPMHRTLCSPVDGRPSRAPIRLPGAWAGRMVLVLRPPSVCKPCVGPSRLPHRAMRRADTHLSACVTRTRRVRRVETWNLRSLPQCLRLHSDITLTLITC